jgi:hypothetical protein
MSFAILLLVGFYFLFLAHSTLLFYLAKESETLTLRQVVLPWPGRGRFVSVFSLLAGLFWFGMLWRAGMPVNWHERNVWWVLSAFAGVPLACYLWCIVHSASQHEGRWRFRPRQDDGRAIRIALVLIVVVNGLFKLLA